MKVYQWFFKRLQQISKKAYYVTKKIQIIKKEFFFFKKSVLFSTNSWHNMFFYIDYQLTKYKLILKYRLLEYQITNFVLILIDQFKIRKFHQISHLISLDLQNLNIQILWIQNVIQEIETWQKDFRAFILSEYIERGKKLKTKDSAVLTNIEMIAYETIGFIPRSITTTLSRFKVELTGQTSLLVFREFWFAKYQALASIQYLFFLLVFPWIVTLIVKPIFFKILIEFWCTANKKNSLIFFNLSQEKILLKSLQNMEELFWLDLVSKEKFENSSQQKIARDIHDLTFSLIELYNHKSIIILIDLLTDLVGILTIIMILFIAKKRVTVLNSWLQELFYSLSDTMKAFFILLLTDLCIGFHSPHGWEVVVESFSEHIGFVPNPHIISFFVSTFPVILDTIVKYWIFRHLNRISPSIVVTYHAMNE
uniref:Potassium/proton antiporter CemA n=1 Tax=Nitella hyalina TaxID=181804 RepID=A0A2H4G3C4_NITHY|nr:envelope membrane protein [Nitella hyalina]